MFNSPSPKSKPIPALLKFLWAFVTLVGVLSLVACGGSSNSTSQAISSTTLVLTATAGNNQSAKPGTALPTALTVEATNNGSPASGVSVTFSASASGGTFGTPTATTNSSGLASTTYTLPATAGSVTVTASANSYTSATFTETATSTTPPASSMLFAADFNHISAVPPPPIWCPTDSNGNVAAITTLRIWDSGMKWSDIETAAGTYNWLTIDPTINTLITNSSCPMGVIYTVGSTPEWASVCAGQPDPGPCLPGPTSSGFGGGTQCANSEDYSCTPPSDVASDGTGTDAQFQAYISAVATRYGSKITYYEIWNEADSPNFWCPSGGSSPPACGTTNTASLSIMVRMAWDLYNIVHCSSSSVKVLSPSFHGFSSGVGGWMNLFVNTSISAPAGSIGGCSWGAATVTGKQTFDITNFHGRGSPNTDPTQFLTVYNAAVGEINRDSLPTAFFDDENGYIGTAEAANTDIQAGYVAIAYILRASVSSPPILLSSWYAWDAPEGPLQGTIVGLSYDVVAGWLSGSKMSACVISGTLYTCPGTTSGGKAFEIIWDMSQNCNSGCTTANQPISAGYSTWTDLTGTSTSIAGGSVPVGYKPILLE